MTGKRQNDEGDATWTPRKRCKKNDMHQRRPGMKDEEKKFKTHKSNIGEDKWRMR